MISTVYLIADKSGVQRLTKRRTELGRLEVAIELTIEIPDECFRSPTIVGNIVANRDEVINASGSVAIGPRRRRQLLIDQDGPERPDYSDNDDA